MTRRRALTWLAVFSYVVLGLLIFFPPKRYVKFFLFKCISLFLFCFLGEKNTSFINVLHGCGREDSTAFSFVTFGFWVPCDHVFPARVILT